MLLVRFDRDDEGWLLSGVACCDRRWVSDDDDDDDDDEEDDECECEGVCE